MTSSREVSKSRSRSRSHRRRSRRSASSNDSPPRGRRRSKVSLYGFCHANLRGIDHQTVALELTFYEKINFCGNSGNHQSPADDSNLVTTICTDLICRQNGKLVGIIGYFFRYRPFSVYFEVCTRGSREF